MQRPFTLFYAVAMIYASVSISSAETQAESRTQALVQAGSAVQPKVETIYESKGPHTLTGKPTTISLYPVEKPQGSPAVAYPAQPGPRAIYYPQNAAYAESGGCSGNVSGGCNGNVGRERKSLRDRLRERRGGCR